MICHVCLNTGIQLGFESNNSGSFLVGSYMNNSRIGDFFSNSEAGSSYLPNLATHLSKLNFLSNSISSSSGSGSGSSNSKIIHSHPQALAPIPKHHCHPEIVETTFLVIRKLLSLSFRRVPDSRQVSYRLVSGSDSKRGSFIFIPAISNSKRHLFPKK